MRTTKEVVDELNSRPETDADRRRRFTIRARTQGYKVIKASPFEVGLVKNGVGIRTWWASDFDCKLPPLGHPVMMDCIKRSEARRDSEVRIAWVSFCEMQREYRRRDAAYW